MKSNEAERRERTAARCLRYMRRLVLGVAFALSACSPPPPPTDWVRGDIAEMALTGEHVIVLGPTFFRNREGTYWRWWVRTPNGNEILLYREELRPVNIHSENVEDSHGC